ncbi:MAG: hypothetical protein JXR51_08210 [Bacteroidales bacterium]|nr:hypothetical protein [Bacteroidales bacterium]
MGIELNRVLNTEKLNQIRENINKDYDNHIEFFSKVKSDIKEEMKNMRWIDDFDLLKFVFFHQLKALYSAYKVFGLVATIAVINTLEKKRGEKLLEVDQVKELFIELDKRMGLLGAIDNELMDLDYKSIDEYKDNLITSDRELAFSLLSMIQNLDEKYYDKELFFPNYEENKEEFQKLNLNEDGDTFRFLNIVASGASIFLSSGVSSIGDMSANVDFKDAIDEKTEDISKALINGSEGEEKKESKKEKIKRQMKEV